MNEGILSKDFPQPLLGHFTRGDDEGVQLIIFITRGGGGGGKDSHMEQTWMLVGNFEFNP